METYWRIKVETYRRFEEETYWRFEMEETHVSRKEIYICLTKDNKLNYDAIWFPGALGFSKQ